MPAPFTFPFSPAGYPNIFIPGYSGDKDAQARLLIGHALNEDVIGLNQWATVIGTDSAEAFYPTFNSSDFVRLKSTTGFDRTWADTTDRPAAMQGIRYTNRKYRLERYGESMLVGNLAEEYSQIGPLVTLSQDTLASRALVWRSVVAGAVLTNSANYITAAAPSIYDNYFADWATMIATLCPAIYPTGYFGTNMYSGTIAAPVFKRFLGHAVSFIQRVTNGRIKVQDLCFVINPVTAAKLSGTEEMHAFQAQQANSLALLKGESPAFEDVFGMPQPTYKIRVVADPTAFTLGPPVADSSTVPDFGRQQYVIPDDFISVCTRAGTVAGMSGSAGFSSVVLFQNKSRAMKPTTIPDIRNERLEVALEDMFTAEMVSPETAFGIGDAAT